MAQHQQVHLVVLQHGLWGEADNLGYVEELLHQYVESRQGDTSCQIRTLNSSVNQQRLSYDGIDICGERLVALIKQTVKELSIEDKDQPKTVTKISFIGYSLGGLIARYAVGKLEHEGALCGEITSSSSGGDGTAKGPSRRGSLESSKLQQSSDGSKPVCFMPVNFITIASPHLGASRDSSGWFDRAYNKMVPIIASRTGHQLMLKDKHAWDRPLLVNMSDQSLTFCQGLSQFSKLMLLANIHYDRMVPYTTAAITNYDPYKSYWTPFSSRVPTVPADDPAKYPSVVKPRDNPPPPVSGCRSGARAERHKLSGSWFICVALLLLPILFPVLLVAIALMSYQGRQHYMKMLRERVEDSWLLQPPKRRSSSSRAPAQAPGPNSPAKGAGDSSVSEQSQGSTQPPSPITPRLTPEQEEDLEKGAMDADVLLTAEKAKVPSTRKEQLEWIVEQMNELPWHKVDVDVRHTHSHAAIVLRNPTRFNVSDHLQYMFAQMHW